MPFCMRRVDKQGVKTICIASNNCLASGIKQETSKQGQLRQEKQVGQYYYSRRSTLTSGINVEGLINVEAAPFSKINKRRGLKNPK